MLRGVYELTLDGKGRVSVPSRFREELVGQSGSELVLTRGLTRCLLAYPLSRWLAFEQRLLARSQFDPNVIRVKRILVAAAMECSLDGQGRILVPPSLRDYAELGKDVVWVGQLDTAELWSSARWKEAHESALQGSGASLTVDDGFAAALAQLGL